MKYLLTLIILLHLCIGNIFASLSSPVFSCDSIKPIRDTLRVVPVVFLPDSLIVDTLRYEYVRIKQIASKTKLTKELYKMIFVDPKPRRLNVMRTQNSEARFRPYAGKTIKNIYIKVLPPYGTSVYDTTYNEDDMQRLKVLANKIHLKTAERVVRKQLTVKPGMDVEPFELVQNEVLLRELSYVDDASIFIDYADKDSTEVDLTFICKDEFSWGAELSTDFLNSGRVELVNKNLFKLGHVIDYQMSYRHNKDKRWGNILNYRINSLFGTHFDFKGYYRNDYREKLVRAEVDRQFLTSNIRWAGGLAFSRVYYSGKLPDRDVFHLQEPFNYNSQDVWLGHSFPLKARYSYNRNIFLTARFFTTTFNDRPLVTPDENHFYFNRRSYFGALTYTKIKYYKANLIYDFGRTEDVPTGLYSAFTYGFENGEFENSGYMGYEARFSNFNQRTERFYSFDAALGSYLNKDGFERALFKAGFNHISNLCSVGNYRYRFYNSVNYIAGLRRFPSDYLYFRDHNIRGFESDTLKGDQKLSYSLATTFFLPFIQKGFRVSLTSFLDGGVLAERGKSIFKSEHYLGIGLGVNIRNDNVVIRNISFRIAYYPRVPSDVRSFQATMSGNRDNEFYNYRVYKPQVIDYE